MNHNFLYSFFIVLMLFLGVIRAQAKAMPMLKATTSNALSTATNSTWVERIPAAAPPAIFLHAMAYDSARGVTVMFGGLSYASGPLKETWELVGGTQWVKHSPINKPAARYGHALAYDVVRDETIMFGGATTAGPDETWAWNGNNWVQKFPTTSPPDLFGPVMTYDGQRGVIVLFGGENQTGIHNETWEWDGISWNQKITTTSPPPRSQASMTYDSGRGKTVLFGGLAGNSKFDDIWEYDGNDWVERTLPGGPSARGGAGLAYDSATQHIVLFGGVSTHEFNETWDWDGTTGIWTQRATPNPPDARSTVMVYDSARSVSVVFGGGSGANGTKIFKDTWEWDDTTGMWTATLPELSPPAAASSNMVYDSLNGEFVLFGGTVGCCGAVNHGETWTWNGTDNHWTKRSPANSPSPRSGQMMAYDSRQGVTILFGGRLISGAYAGNDTWEWDGTNWAQRSPASAPAAREETTMAYDVDRGVSVLFGGRNNGTLYSDTWEWDGTNWSQRFPAYSPSARVGTRLVYDKLRHVTVLFGGADTTGTVLNDTWEWDGTDWTQKNPIVSPQPVAAHGMAYDDAQGVIVMFGGQDQSTHWDTSWEWDGTNWTQITVPIHPPARAGHAMAYNSERNRIVIFGGNWSLGVIDDTWEYEGPAPSNSAPVLTMNNSSITVDEGQTASNTGTYADTNAGDNVTVSASVGTVSKTGINSGSWSWSYATTDGPAQSQTVIITANDGQGGVSTTSFSLTVNNANPTVTAPSVSLEPSKEDSPVTVNATFSDPGVNDAPFTCTINYGDGSGDLAGIVGGNTCTGPAHTYAIYGSYTVTVRVIDKDNGTGSNSVTHAVIYPFMGFFPPVDNPPTVNTVNAGQAIPVKFSLGGNRGLDIFVTGYPVSQSYTCGSGGGSTDPIEQTVTAGGSSLSYDPASDQYTYVWKTDKSWAGTCRQLIVRLNDGTDHVALFRFNGSGKRTADAQPTQQVFLPVVNR